MSERTSKNFLRELVKPQAPDVDVVAVHGLNPSNADYHAEETWIADDKLWLRDFLPRDLPNARVLLFGYNSNVAFETSTAGVREQALNLLNRLKLKRRDTVERPIIFVAHSLGGIIVKRALIEAKVNDKYASIREATYGIAFFGTPHQGGGNHAKLGDIAATICRGVIQNPQNTFMEALKKDSLFSKELVEDFKHQLEDYYVLSFYETLPFKKLGLIVDKKSATLGLPGSREEQIALDADHSNVCKFKSAADDNYEHVSENLVELVQAATKACLERQRLADLMMPTGDTGQAIATGNRVRPRDEYFHVLRNVSSIFVGCKDALETLENCLLIQPQTKTSPQQKVFAIYGLGGSGKTQVCLKFAQDNRDRFSGVFWVDASSSERAEQSFADIAVRGGHERSFEAGKLWLSNSIDGWLLIIDNADDISLDISNYFPPGNRGCILITSRNPNCRMSANVGSYELNAMDREDAIKLLLLAAGEDTQDPVCLNEAMRIAEILGNLALALVLAGATICQKRCRLDEYLDLYSRNHQELMNNHPVQGTYGYRNNVYTTWNISRQAIEDLGTEVSSVAMKLLDISGFLYREGIPKKIFDGAYIPTARKQGIVFQALDFMSSFFTKATPGLDSDRIGWAIVLLSSYSLISIDKATDYFSVHPLVHTWTRDRLTKELRLSYRRSATIIIADAISNRQEAGDFAFRRRLLNHVNFCLYDSNPILLDEEPLNLNDARMAAKFALVLSENGKYSEAERLCRRSLGGTENMLGKERLETLRRVNDLALVLESMGKDEEAEAMHHRALRSWGKVLDPVHLDILESLGNLAVVLQNQGSLGEYEEAEDLAQKALRTFSKVSGTKHRKTLESMNGLASLLQQQGKFGAAENMYQQALDGYEEVLGLQHPEALTCMSNFAWLLLGQDKLEAAKKMNQQVLDERERVLGQDHPDTLTSVSNQAVILKSLGMYEVAEEMSRRALDGYQRKFGQLHPYTLTSMDNLAGILHVREKFEEAEEMGQQALRRRVTALRSDHPDTLTGMNNLAYILESQGKYDAAEQMYRRALSGREKQLGSQHPVTVANLSDLAWVLNIQGKYHDEETVRRRTIESSERAFGLEHPDTLEHIYVLAKLLKSQKQFTDASILYHKAYAGYRKLNGPGHHYTVECSQSYHSMLEEMNKNGLENEYTQSGASVHVAESRSEKRKQTSEAEESTVTKMRKVEKPSVTLLHLGSSSE